MDESIVPLYLIVNISSLTSNFLPLDEKSIKKLKDNYNFKEVVEKQDNKLDFNDGFPVISCSFTEKDIFIGIINLKDELPIIEINNLLESIGFFEKNEEGIVANVDLMTLPKYEDNDSVIRFFINCDNNSNEKFGEMIESYFYFETVKNSKHIRLTYNFSKKSSYSSAQLKTPFKFSCKDDLEKGILESIRYLIETMADYLSTRK